MCKAIVEDKDDKVEIVVGPVVEERKFNSKRQKLVVYPNKKWEEGEERKGTKER